MQHPILAADGHPVSTTQRHSKSPWQLALIDAVRDTRELYRLLDLPEILVDQGAVAARQFPIMVPKSFISRMRKGNVNDPLLRQVLPTGYEVDEVPGFVQDPVHEAAAEIVPGLLQKYAGRALLITTGVCAVHCRYCFRRHFPYEDASTSENRLQSALRKIDDDESLREVILSGGDPLTLPDDRLERLAEQLSAIRHVRRLRVHTRLPVMIPERVTNHLLAWLTGTRLVPLIVIHANHAQEIDHNVAAALGKLMDAGVPVLNQAVLLAGVNDTVEAQIELWERLIDLRVMPYYLHRLDRVAGAAHFDVPLETGRTIIRTLRERLPGYGVPRFVEEVAGARSKTPLA